MQYHAHALAACGVDVDLIGFGGTPLPKRLADNTRISVHYIGEARMRSSMGRSTLFYPLAAFSTPRCSPSAC